MPDTPTSEVTQPGNETKPIKQNIEHLLRKTASTEEIMVILGITPTDRT